MNEQMNTFCRDYSYICMFTIKVVMHEYVIIKFLFKKIT